MSRARALYARHRDLVLFTLAALVVRAGWSRVHRPLDYVASDMKGYLDRAQLLIDDPGLRSAHLTLFPWGTHTLLALVKRVFDPYSAAPIGLLYAALGAGAVAYGYLLAKRLTRSVAAARAVGAVLVVYYPWIALGGYVLSEPPFTFFLGMAAYHGLALADRGRPRDAWLLGAALALGAAFRPQILASVPLLGLHLLLRRPAWRRPTLRLAVAVALPLALVLGASGARVRWHTGHLGLISTNGPLNYAFGRCHALTIASSGGSKYTPPAFGALARHGDEHPDALVRLDPAMGSKLEFQGQMWDAEPLRALGAECVRRTGLGGQVRYALTHLALLWTYNDIWPDSVNTRGPYRRLIEIAGLLHDVLVLPGALVGLALALRQRHARELLVALHVLGLFAVAVVYFGDTRLRAPYDAFLVTLAAITYGRAYRLVRRALRSRAASPAG